MKEENQKHVKATPLKATVNLKTRCCLNFKLENIELFTVKEGVMAHISLSEKLKFCFVSSLLLSKLQIFR